jgi:ligand-binding sensor domain-containing protein
MGKYRLVILVMLLVVAVKAKSLAAQQIEWQDIGSGNMHFGAVWVDPDDRHILLAGSENSLIKTENDGGEWRCVLSLRGKINLIAAAGADNRYLFAASEKGLYLSRDRGNNWKKVFKGKSYLESDCTAVLVLNNNVYLGTKAGLFFSSDECRSWQKASGVLASTQVTAIAAGKDRVYIASARGVFKMDNATGRYDKIFISYHGGSDEEQGEAPEENSSEASWQDSGAFCLIADQRAPENLYLASASGICASKDSGSVWEALSDYGLFDKNIRSLALSSDALLFAASDKSVFVYNENRWQEISFNLAAQDISGMVFDNQGSVYVACSRGLFKAAPGNFRKESDNMVKSQYLDVEPQISAIQEAAIKYAEVEPEKIISWRKQAAKKGFLPKFSAGVSRDTADLWHWESGSSTKAYDDTLMRGRDSVDWSVTLSWDLSEIIWSSEQTSIDTRSRLMVQLRDDVLDEVTKLYFERIRVKSELDNIAIEDRKKRFEKELRLAELTAMLDGLTGGYLSRAANKHSI